MKKADHNPASGAVPVGQIADAILALPNGGPSLPNAPSKHKKDRAGTRLYRLLRQYGGRIPYEDAAQLCKLAIQKNIPQAAFAALLDACCPDGLFDLDKDSLVRVAVWHDRPALLALLLERGMDPNYRSEQDGSLVEIAAEWKFKTCLDLLLRHPALKLTLTPALLELWAGYDPKSSNEYEAVLLLLAKKLPASLFYPCAAPLRLPDAFPALYAPADPSVLPLPRALNLDHAARHDNAWLFCRLCELGVRPDRDQARRMLGCLSGLWFLFWENRSAETLDPDIRLLDWILYHHPALLDEEQAACRVVHYALPMKPEDRQHRLGPWLEGLRGRPVSLLGATRSDDLPSLDYALENWPDGPVPAFETDPALDEDDGSLVLDSLGTLDERRGEFSELLEQILARCVILRKGKRDEPVSWLARRLLEYGRPQTARQQLRPGGLLAGEDPQALLEYCTGPGAGRVFRETAALLAADGKLQKNYAL